MMQIIQKYRFAIGERRVLYGFAIKNYHNVMPNSKYLANNILIKFGDQICKEKLMNYF